jgi:hypothetical protein
MLLLPVYGLFLLIFDYSLLLQLPSALLKEIFFILLDFHFLLDFKLLLNFNPAFQPGLFRDVKKSVFQIQINLGS